MLWYSRIFSSLFLMSRFSLPISASAICRHGSHVLLLRRSKHTESWPLYWGFPGGKVENDEFFRETALRELREEVGVHALSKDIQEEVCVLYRSIQGMKMGYFGQLHTWENAPENLEPRLAAEIGWFDIEHLPSPMIPQHEIALRAI
jgi:8-oxo-dGTP pyrophosphatase MutT (NUDIX family)